MYNELEYSSSVMNISELGEYKVKNDCVAQVCWYISVKKKSGNENPCLEETIIIIS